MNGEIDKKTDEKRLRELEQHAKNNEIRLMGKWARSFYENGESRKAAKILRAAERMQEVAKK